MHDCTCTKKHRRWLLRILNLRFRGLVISRYMTPTTPCCKKCSKSQNYGLCDNAACPCHTKPATKNPSWEGDRSKWDGPMVKYTSRIHDEVGDLHHDVWDAIKKALYVATTQQKNELIGRIEGIRRPIDKSLGYEHNRYDLGNNDALDDIIRTLEEQP